MKYCLDALVSNPLVSYYRNLWKNYQTEKRAKAVSIDRSAMVVNSTLSDYVKIGPRTIVVDAKVAAFSYVAQDARLSFVRVGKFCSIGPHVKIGYGLHPVDRVSTHPIFYSTRGQCGLVLRRQETFEEQRETILGNDVWIGAASILMDGITVNDGAIVAAGSVVTKDVPPYAIVGGVPAKVIRMRATTDEIDAMRRVAWWDWSEEQLEGKLDKFNGSIAAFLQGGLVERPATLHEGTADDVHESARG